MQMPIPPQARIVSIWVISTTLLFFGFLSNAWRVAEQGWFKNHQRDTESLIIGRMVKSRQDGLFSAGGLTGAGTESSVQQGWVTAAQIEQQYAAYLNGLTFEDFSPYMSQSGGQGMVFSVLDRLIPLSRPVKLRTFYVLTSLLTALTLSAIVGWFYVAFGGWAAAFVLASMVLSQWLTVFGRNLWWSLWAFYLPMLVGMYFLRRANPPTNRRVITFGILSFIAVFVKCFINGFEYMTTTLVMMMVPLVYYAIAGRWNARQLLKWTLAAVSGACVAIGVSLTLLCVQIGAVKGSFKEGIAHVIFSVGKRTHGHAQDFPAVYANSLEASTISVVMTYIKGIFFKPDGALSGILPEVGYAHLIVAFIAASLLLFFHIHEKSTALRKQDYIALIFATWFSMLAPLSWYVIFKAHSYIHTHMSYLLWQMPFTFFGFAICGLVVKRAFSDVARLARRAI